MYLTFFGLNEKPFAITPDPRYLYLSERHAEALAHLLYGINEAGGFVQLTGEVGTGKTTIVRSLLAQTPKNAEIALILNPKMTAPEFLLTICEELGIGVPGLRAREPARTWSTSSATTCCAPTPPGGAWCWWWTRRRTCRPRCSSRCACSPTSRPTRRSCCRSS